MYIFQGAAKVSILMIGQQAIMDAYLCLLHLTAGILVGKFKLFMISRFLFVLVYYILPKLVLMKCKIIINPLKSW